MGLKDSHSSGWSVLALGLGITFYMITLSQAVPVNRLSKRFETNWGSNNTFSGYESCNTGSKVYKSGEIVRDKAGPCEECICKPPNIQCTMVHCPMKTGCKMIQRPNQCCPQFQCDCEFNGKNYFNGEQIEAQLDKPCEVCYCKGGDVMCTSVTCYERSDCQAKIVPGQCCPKYENCPPRGVKESGQSEKTEGGIDNDSKTKKREMQPWLLTNPAEEAEKHETTEINASTDTNEEATSAQTIEEKTTVTDNLSTNHVDNLSTEYRLVSDNAAYDTIITEFPSSTLSFTSTTNKIPDNVTSTEVYESGTELLEDILGRDNLNYDFPTVKDDVSLGTTVTSDQITKFETMTPNILRDEEPTYSSTFLFPEPSTETAKLSVGTQESEQKNFRTDLMGNIKKLEITSNIHYSDSSNIVTTPFYTKQEDMPTPETESLGQKTNNSTATLTENSDTTDVTTQINLQVVHQDFQNLNAAINSEDIETDFGGIENRTKSNFFTDTEMAQATSVKGNIEVSPNNSSIKDYVTNIESQTEEQKEDQPFRAETETPSTTIVEIGKDTYKVDLTIGQIEEKATVESQLGFPSESFNNEKNEEQKEVSEILNSYSERASTQMYERSEMTTTKIDSSLKGDTTTYKSTEDDKLKANMAQEKLEADTSKAFYTTESEAYTKWINEEPTKTYMDHTQKETELEKIKDSAGENTRNTVRDVLYSTSSQFKNEEITEPSVTSTVKSTEDLIKNEKVIEKSDSESQTTQRNIEIYQDHNRDELEIDTSSDSTQDLQLLSTTTNKTTYQEYLVTAYGTEESTEGEQTTLDQSGLTHSEESTNKSDAGTDIDTVSIGSLSKLVVPSVTATNNLDNKLTQQQDKEEINSQTLATEKNDDTSTTEALYTTVSHRNKIDNKGNAESFDKDTYMSAQLLPERDEYGQKLGTNNEITTESYIESSSLPQTTSGAGKFIPSTEFYTSSIKNPIRNEHKNISDSFIDPDKNQIPSSTPFAEEYTLTENADLVQSILNLAISMQTPNNASIGIQPPKYIPIKYVGQTEESKLEENLNKRTEFGRPTTLIDKKTTFSTYITENIEETTENLGDTKLVEQLITKHLQNLTQIALAPIANELLNLVSKSNKTEAKKDSSPSNVQDEIFLPKDSEIEKIAEQIRNATIHSFQESFETMEEELGDDNINSTKTPELSQPAKPKMESVSPYQHKVRRRQNKIRTKK